MSETVSTAIFSGTNCLLSSMPGMALIREVTSQTRERRARSLAATHDAVTRQRPVRESVSSKLRAANVLQPATVPPFSPVLNQRWRCSEEPWVKLSGTT